MPIAAGTRTPSPPTPPWLQGTCSWLFYRRPIGVTPTRRFPVFHRSSNRGAWPFAWSAFESGGRAGHAAHGLTTLRVVEEQVGPMVAVEIAGGDDPSGRPGAFAHCELTRRRCHGQRPRSSFRVVEERIRAAVGIEVSN